MKRYKVAAFLPVVGLLLFAVAAAAQPSGKLESDFSDLLKLRPGDSLGGDDVAKRLTADILAVAATDARPSRQTVREFVDDMTAAILLRDSAPRTVPGRMRIHDVTAAIRDVFQGPHVTAAQFNIAIDTFRSGLVSVGAPDAEAERVAHRLLLIGRDLRGPEQHAI